MLRQNSFPWNRYARLTLLLILLWHRTTVNCSVAAVYDDIPLQYQRHMSTTFSIMSNALIQSSFVTTLACDTSYDTLMVMNTPHIQYVTRSNTTTTTTNPEVEDTVRRGIFATLWRFLCRLWPLQRISKSSSTISSSSSASNSTTSSNDNNDHQTHQNRTLFFGTEQVTSINQNPIIVVFDSDTQQRLWCYNTYEVAGADGRAIGALHAHIQSHNDENNDETYPEEEILYIVLTIDGTQGTTTEDVRRFTSPTGWIPSYGNGGGPKVSVVVQVNTTTGEPMTGTYLRSQLPSNGRTNSLVVTQLSYEERNCNVTANTLHTDSSLFQLRVQAEAYFLPMSLDGMTPMNETECLPDVNSPFNYTVTLSPKLDRAYTADCRAIHPQTSTMTC